MAKKKNTKKNKLNKKLPDELIDNYEGELKNVLDTSDIENLRKILMEIYTDEDSASVHIFMGYVINEIRNFNKQKRKFSFEFDLANKIYNQFEQESKNDSQINGKLLAINLIKFNKIIEQNEMIIKLLNEIK